MGISPDQPEAQLAFEVPARPARRDLIDYFLARKAHAEDLDNDEIRDQLKERLGLGTGEAPGDEDDDATTNAEPLDYIQT